MGLKDNLEYKGAKGDLFLINTMIVLCFIALAMIALIAYT